MNREEHPRPQLVRNAWQDLDGEWAFAYDDDRRGLTESWFLPERRDAFDRTILVPFAPEAPLSGIGDQDFHPVVWYRRFLESPPAGDDSRILLHFGAVDYEATVWVNGQLVGHHVGGQASFTLDITAALVPAAKQDLVVRAVDEHRDAALPRGKQDWEHEPHFIWYERTTGIWQSVWAETVPAQRISRLDWTTDVAEGAITASIELAEHPSPGLSVELRFTCGTEVLAEVVTALDSLRSDVTVRPSLLRHGEGRKRYLWSPESPTLLDVDVRLRKGGDEVDRVSSYVGIRDVGTSAGRFTLNGAPYYLRAVLEQGYWPESHFTAPSPSALRDEVDLIRSLGFNCVRIHQKVEDPRFLYWADRRGLLVWSEIGAAYEFSPAAIEAHTRQWLDVVRRDLSHPCIVAWVPFNESWGVPDVARSAAQQQYVQGLTSLTRALDPSRLVVSNDGWEHVDSDLLTVHDYSSYGQELRTRYATEASILETALGPGPQGRPVLASDAERARAAETRAPLVLSEFGGLAFVGDDTWGYTLVGTRRDYEAGLRDLFDAIRSSPHIAGYCYTQLTDTRQEANGITDARRSLKLPLDAVRRIVLGAEPAIGSADFGI